MAYRDRLQRELGSDFYGYYASEGQRMDVGAILRRASPTTDIYVCGPQKLIDDVFALAANLGINKQRIYADLIFVAKPGIQLCNI